jgi:hypothetical protein
MRDPFWEFGSFGKTGCHEKNLLHPQRCKLQDGDRLAFIQGGRGELKIVGLTPAIKVAGSTNRLELKWDKSYRPLPYVSAPLLINNSRKTAFPSVFSALRLNDTNRSTFCGRVASRLRSRTTPMNHELSEEILRWFASKRHPRIRLYPQAIQAETGAWYKHAIDQRWPSVAQRASAYRAASGISRKSCASPKRGC